MELIPTRDEDVPAWALAKARSIVLRHIRGLPIQAWLFGSRATDRARRFSDIDVALDSHQPIAANLVAEIALALEESIIPYQVDVVNLSTADAAMAARIRREGVLWTD